VVEVAVSDTRGNAHQRRFQIDLTTA